MFRSASIMVIAVACFLQTSQGFPNAPEAPVEILSRNTDHFQALPVSGAEKEVTPAALRCGGVLSAESGEISYKTDGNVVGNERCSWVISVPRAVGYHLLITHLGSPTNAPGSTQELDFTSVRQPSSIPTQGAAPILTTYKPTGVGSLPIDGSHLIVVTFTTSDSVNGAATGFSLQYVAIKTGGSLRPVSSLSTHSFHDSSTPFSSRYPEGRTYYDNYELASTIFHPTNNIYDGNNRRIKYVRDQLEGSTCYDGLHTYLFNRTAPAEVSKWYYAGSICGNVAEQELVHNDAIFTIFQSDSSQTYRGFSFEHETC